MDDLNHSMEGLLTFTDGKKSLIREGIIYMDKQDIHMLKSVVKQLFCKHSYSIYKWHFTHGQNGNEPRYIEGFEICSGCGKLRYFTVERGSKWERYIIDNMKERQWPQGNQ